MGAGPYAIPSKVKAICVCVSLSHSLWENLSRVVRCSRFLYCKFRVPITFPIVLSLILFCCSCVR